MTDQEKNPGSHDKDAAWTPSQISTSRGDEDGISLGDLIGILRNGKWTIAAVTAGTLVLALLYAFLAPPVYEVDAMVQIQQQNQPSEASSDILSALLPIAAPADTEIDIMTSRAVLQPTVEREHLNIQVDSGSLPIIGRFFSHPSAAQVVVSQLEVPDDWMDQELELTAEGNGEYELASPSGERLLRGQVGKPASARNGTVKITVKKLDIGAGKSVSLKRLYDLEAVSLLQQNLTATEQGKDTGIVQLTLDGTHPRKIKAILDTLVNQYIDQNVAAMATQAKNSLSFIQKQLPKLKRQLDSAQNKLTAYREKNGAVDLDKQAETMLQELTTLESELTQINLAEAAMRQRYTIRYPGLKSLQSQEEDIQGKIDAIHSQINQLPSQEQAYMALMRDVKVYEQLYTALLTKAQDLQIAEASTTGTARVVDYAAKPITPVAPRKAVAVALGLILGLVLGVLVVLLRRALTRGIEDSAELESSFGLPVYAVVPHSGRQEYLINRAKRRKSEKIAILAVDDPQDPTVESLRSLRTSINFALNGSRKKVITLGGCAPGVGKSFLSVNLAHVMGAANTKVLVIDADMRLGHLDRYLGGRKEPGLSQILSGQASLGEAVYVSPYNQNIHFLPSGPYPPNPYELISGPRLGPLLETCSEEYDVVIVDVPPVLAVAEGLILSRHATANFLVVKAGMQSVQEVRVALDRIRQNGIKLEGFVFNDLTRQAASYTYGRYAMDHYYSRYGGRRKK